MQERYWRYLQHLKADSYYYQVYGVRSECLDNWLSISAAVISSGSVGGWAIWKDIPWLWGILIGAAQVLAVSKQFFPMRKRATILRALAQDLDELYVEAESKWFHVSQGNLQEIEINELNSRFKKRENEIEKKRLGEHTLPHSNAVRTKADQLTVSYFLQAFNAKPAHE